VLLGDQPGPYEVNVLVRTTGPDGRASFTIRGKKGEAGLFGNEVSFKATWTNAEGDVQTKILHVHVRPAGS